MAYQPVGDTLALAVLAFNLYRKGYQVAKHAPDEFKSLLSELNLFKRTVWQVQKSLQTQNDLGDLGSDIVLICTNVLLKDFQPLVLKYEKLAYAERGQDWIRRFQFAADQDAIRAANSKLDRAQKALYSWLAVDTRELCRQYFESLKTDIVNQQHRIETQPVSRLEKITTGSSFDYASIRSVDHDFDTLNQRDPLNRTNTVLRRPNLDDHLRPSVNTSNLVFQNPFTTAGSRAIRGVASFGLTSPRQTSDSLGPALGNQDSDKNSDQDRVSNLASVQTLRSSSSSNDGPRVSSDSNPDANDPDQSVLDDPTPQKSTIDERFFTKLERSYPPRPELEELFEKSAMEDVDAGDGKEAWVYRATWWVLKALQLWNILKDPRASLSTVSSSSTGWMTEDITLEQTIVDLMKAGWILHTKVLAQIQVGDQLPSTLFRQLNELARAIKQGMSRESRGVNLETSTLLEQRTALVELIISPLEQKDNMPEALNTMETGARFLEVNEDIAGKRGERVLYRTFVNAQIGGRDQASKSPDAPYLLILWMQKYRAGFEVSLLNQSGSLSLNLSMTREAVIQYDQDLTAQGNELRLDFPGQKAIIKFLTDSDAEKFLAHPREFFSQVKDRYPRADEFLVYRTGLHACQGPRQIGRNRFDNTTQPSRACEISLFNHVPSNLWKMTRRLVLCSVPSKWSTPPPFSKSVWLPLDHIRVSVTSREVKLLWSDCGHLEKKSLGDYREEYGYVYKPHEPNQELHLTFRSAAAAADFANHILLPFDTGLHLEKQIQNIATIQPLQAQETQIVQLRDLDAPEDSGYYALVSTQRSPTSHSHSMIHFAYADNDIRLDLTKHRVELLRLRQPRYFSAYNNLTSIEQSTPLSKLSACKTIRAAAGSQTFQFDKDTINIFLSALTGWTIVFSKVARNIQLTSRGFRPSTSSGAGEVQLWTKRRVAPIPNPIAIRLAVRVIDRGGEPRWYTTSITKSEQLEQPKINRVAVKSAQESWQQGALLESRWIRASNDVDANVQSTNGDHQQKYTKLTIDFHDPQHFRELMSVVEQLFMFTSWQDGDHI